RFREALMAGTLRLSAPEHMKVEMIRLLKLGVRGKRYTLDEGIALARAFEQLPITHVTNDSLFEDAFRLASRYMMALTTPSTWPSLKRWPSPSSRPIAASSTWHSAAPSLTWSGSRT
ncbi:MAG: hypothetical protein ACRDJN_20665, partial [Chloroflexota bacterium]